MNYLNIHMLFTFAAGNPNRDESGVPKTVIYGGVERSRISSQAMTRPKRHGLEVTDEKTYRSKFIPQRVADEVIRKLESQGTSVNDAQRTAIVDAAKKSVLLLTSNGESTKKSSAKASKKPADTSAAESEATEETTNDGEEVKESKKDTLVWLGSREIDALVSLFVSQFPDVKAVTKVPEIAFIGPKTTSLSIASFGRMFASAPTLQNEAAIQRSHAFTTHGVSVGVDYFTAADDLNVENKGASHMDTAMLTSGVFYWHCNLDIRQLAEVWSGIHDDDARERLISLFNAIAWELPTGRANTSAYRGAPSLIVVQPANSPVSLQSAFETPVSSTYNGHLLPSAEALLDESRFVSNLQPSHFDETHLALASANLKSLQTDGTTVENLDDLAGWFADYVLGEAK
jgi:CRISPR system Cascade subunit CasC